LGQHFLVDKSILQSIVEAANLKPDDVVIEIGPGRGVITTAIANFVSKVVAIELDLQLSVYLDKIFNNFPNVNIINEDARKVDPKMLVGDAEYKVIGNLPYYAALPIIRGFLEANNKPKIMVVMIQKEVAQNMQASSGQMNLLSIAVQLFSNPEIIAYVPPKAFNPQPKVTSAIVKLEVFKKPILNLDSLDEFFKVVKAGFSTKRKQLKNSLSNKLNISNIEAEKLLLEVSIDPKRRAQTLNLKEWGLLYNCWSLNYKNVDIKSPRQN